MVDQVCPCGPAIDDGVDRCHPYLRTSFRTAPPVATYLQNDPPCNSCCVPDVPNEMSRASGTCDDKIPLYRQEQSSGKDQRDFSNHVHCVAHSCPLGKIVCCSDCNKDDCAIDKTIIKAVELPTQEDDRFERRGLEFDGLKKEERACCPRKTSWTEPRICRCDLSNPMDVSKRCQCECGATIAKEEKRKEKKSVRFNEPMVTIDCDEVFRNLRDSDVKDLCTCCKECVVKGEEKSVGQPVLLYELPEPKFEGTSITQKDFTWKKAPSREVPPWHPSVRNRWCHLDVPSLTETTYQSDYKRPLVSFRDPVPEIEETLLYSSPPKEERSDPCPPQEYPTWEKTTKGPAHVYHSACDNCDRDLHRVHLHECDATNLPPLYQCHGDGHIGQSSCQAEDKLAPCETKDVEKSNYWWKRSCCDAEHRRDTSDLTQTRRNPIGQSSCQAEDKLAPCETEEVEKSNYWWKISCCDAEQRRDTSDLTQTRRNPTCHGYATGCKHGYRDHEKLETDGNLGNCSACEYCTGESKNGPPRVLCTPDRSQSFMTQRAGII